MHFHKLVTALRTAVAKEGILDKEATSYDDILDAMRLCVRGFEQVQDNNAVGTSWSNEHVTAAAVIEEEVRVIEEEYREEKPKWRSYKNMGIGY
jgi:hypothetical protein